MLFAGFKLLSLSILLQLFFQVSENLREAQEWFKTKFGNLQAELVRSRYEKPAFSNNFPTCSKINYLSQNKLFLFRPVKPGLLVRRKHKHKHKTP